MRRKEGRKKQERSNKQQGKATQYYMYVQRTNLDLQTRAQINMHMHIHVLTVVAVPVKMSRPHALTPSLSSVPSHLITCVRPHRDSPTATLTTRPLGGWTATSHT